PWYARAFDQRSEQLRQQTVTRCARTCLRSRPGRGLRDLMRTRHPRERLADEPLATRSVGAAQDVATVPRRILADQVQLHDAGGLELLRFPDQHIDRRRTMLAAHQRDRAERA